MVSPNIRVMGYKKVTPELSDRMDSVKIWGTLGMPRSFLLSRGKNKSGGGMEVHESFLS